MKLEKENIKDHHSPVTKEQLSPPVDLQPFIRAFQFLVRQLSRLLPYTHPLLVFPLLFGDNIVYDYNGFESPSTVPGDNANENAASPSPIKPKSSETPGKGDAVAGVSGFFNRVFPVIFPPALEPEPAQPGRDSLEYLKETKDSIHNFKGPRGGLSIPVIEVFNKRTFDIKENEDVSPGFTIKNHGGRSSIESPVIKAVKNVRFINRLALETQKQQHQAGPELRIPFSSNVYNQKKMDPGSMIINEKHREYSIGLSSLHTVNRSLGFLNDVIRPTIVQVRLEEEAGAISHPAVEKIHIDRADHVNHVNHVKFLRDKVSRSAAQFTSIQEIQEKTGSQNTFQTIAGQAIPYIPMPAKHFLETRRVDTAAGVSSMLVRMKTYNITPSLTSLATAGNILLEKLVSLQASSDDQPTAQRAIKSFSGGPGGRFFKKAPLTVGGTLSPFRHELSAAVIVEKMYTQFTNGTKGSDANLSFSRSRDNQNQEVTNTFNVTMNVNANSSFIQGDTDSLQDLGEKLAEILTDEARRYGIKV